MLQRQNRKPANALLAVLATALALGTAFTSYAGDLRSVARSVLKVQAIDARGGVSSGSAVVVDRGKAVTACHVTQAATRVRLLQDDSVYEVTEQLVDIAHDLCLLSVEGLDRPAVAIASAAELATGESVFALGYAFGGRARVAMGVVEQLHDYDGGKVIETSAGFHHGDSGGGLFNSRGELVGVLAFMLGDEGARHFVVPADWLRSVTANRAFAAVEPIADGKPFWMGSLVALPFFLQAVAHDENQNWEALLVVTEAWSHAEPNNLSARTLRAKALVALGRTATLEAAPVALNR